MPKAATSYGAQISFSPRWWSYVTSTRIMVASFCNVALANEELAGKIALSAQELLENAVKYSADPDEDVVLLFSIEDDQVITLEVSNVASAHHIASLREQHAAVSVGDPLTAFLKKMQRIAQNPDTGESQLGLARIRYETGNDIGLEVTGHKVTMWVRFDLENGGGLR